MLDSAIDLDAALEFQADFQGTVVPSMNREENRVIYGELAVLAGQFLRRMLPWMLIFH